MLKKLTTFAIIALITVFIVPPATAGVGGCGPRSGVGGCTPGGGDWLGSSNPSIDRPANANRPSFVDLFSSALPIDMAVLVRAMFEKPDQAQSGSASDDLTFQGVGGCGPRAGVGGCKL